MAWLAIIGLVIIMWSPAWVPGFRYGPQADYNAPIWLWTLGGIAGAGLAIARRDRWLGLAVVAVAARAVPTLTDLAASTALWFAVGAAALLVIASLPSWTLPVLPVVLSSVAALQVTYMILQWWQIDPPWFGWRPNPHYILPAWPTGTMGNPRYAGAVLAVIAPLAPWWGLPWLGLGLGLSGSYLALIAAGLGLTVRWGGRLTLLGGLIAILLLAGLALTWSRGNTTFDSARFRLHTWSLMASDVAAGGPGTWLFGRGPAGFATRMWPQQGNELSAQAHSDVAQWLYEMGAVGAALVVGWVRHTGRILIQAPRRWQGAVVALAVLACGVHPFHVPALAAGMILVLGGSLASGRGRETEMEAR